MTLGWIRGQSRSLGIDLEPAAELVVDGSDTVTNLSARTRREIIVRGTLFHERTHWLNLIGTTSGLFHMAVWETQALTAKKLLGTLNDYVNIDAFPLMSLAYKKLPDELSTKVNRYINAWTGLRDLQSYFFGNQHTLAVSAPTIEAFAMLSNFLNHWLAFDSANMAGSRSDKYDCPTIFGQVQGVSSKDRIQGFYQLTEALARLNEYALMQSDLTKHFHGAGVSDLVQLPLSFLFEGDYGSARNRFYEITGREKTHASEAILAVLVHDSLNTSLPPASSMAVFSNPWLAFNAYARFLEFARLTANYKPGIVATLNLAEFRRIRREVRHSLLEKGLVESDEALGTHVQQTFKAFADFQIPQDLYRLDCERSVPIDDMRYRYLGRIFHDTFGYYRSDPDFLVFPALFSIHDPARSRELYEVVRPPVLFIENEGYRPSWSDPAAHAVLMLDTLINEVLFAAMNGSYEQMIKGLKTYVRHSRHQEHTTDTCRVALLNAGFQESMAAQIIADLGI